MNNDTFHFYVDDMCHKGYLSKNQVDGQAVYCTTRLGLDVLQRFSELQTYVAPLEHVLGRLLL